MKFKLILAITILAMAAVPGTPRPAAAQDYIPPQLAYIDAQVDVMIPRLMDFQKQYQDVAKGAYYQALTSSSTIPAVPIAPDGIKGAPTDQAADLAYFWDGIAALPPTLAWSFRIDTYDGPQGSGYVLIVDTRLNDGDWERAINFGPEDWREYKWQPVKSG